METTREHYRVSRPRIEGIHEQYRRAQRLLRLAKRCKKPKSRFTNLIAAVYPARAVVELMLEAAEKQDFEAFQNENVKRSREDLEQRLVQGLPHYYLIEKIRIHDFHRFGCLPPDPTRRVAFFGGPVTLQASKGAAALKIGDRGFQVTVRGQSAAKQPRPLYTDDSRFFEQESGRYLFLEEILTDFLDAVPGFLAELSGRQ